jgi:phosphotransferase system  glucose/maltose/N-acetylglucosamine-specific IIC component
MISVRQVPVVALLALLPVAMYAFLLYPIVAIALVNVVLIAASVYVMFLPSESAVKPASA